MKLYDVRLPVRKLPTQRITIMLLAIALFFSACKDDDDPGNQDSTFGQGVFITNEGAFLQGTGTVYFYDKERDTLLSDIFQARNSGQVLGNIVQSLYVHNERAYIVVNNANKIEVVDRKTFKSIGTIEGLELPRKIIAVSPDRAFISQWGLDGISGSIAVVDLNGLTVQSTIPCGRGPDDMLLQSGNVYVANSGGFGNDSTVVVINVSDEQITNQIIVSDNPTGLEEDADGLIWVLCRGYNDFTDPSNDRAGSLVHLDGTDIIKTLEVPNGSTNLVINNEKNSLFFLSPPGILKHRIDGGVLPTTSLVFGSFYALGIDPQSDDLYASDARDFQSPGQVIRYSSEGTALDTLAAGIIPGSFWFN